jgi:predicted regulator of Ras-like GTPase activity (Roadblock/LC7/MglB family)
MMEQILEDIECIPGISGVYYFNPQHGTILKKAGSDFSDNDLATVGKTLVKIYSEGSEAFSDIDKVSLYYKESNLVIFKVTNENYLIVIHDSKLNRNLMNMTIAQAIKDLKQLTVNVSPPDKSDNPGKSPATEASESKESNSSQIESILNSEPLSEILDAMEKSLNKILGPMASIIFKDLLEIWIKENEPGADSIDKLAKLVYREINDPEKINTYKVLIDPFIKKI